jgi:mRNA-degrading endonuclease YafQ of YafQ-DinJ toxin-antitoxin module
MYDLIKDDKFVKKAKKFFKRHPELKTKFRDIILTLSNDPFEPSLKTHKLKRKLECIQF